MELKGKINEMLEKTEIDDKIKEGADKLKDKVDEVLEKTEPGAFSERVWTLDNRTLYRIGENDQ